MHIDEIHILNSEIQAFLEAQKSLMIGALNTSMKEPNCELSYAPFLYQEQAFFIFISRLAPHTNQLLALQRCGILLIEDEASCTNIFARKRLALTTTVDHIDKSAATYQSILTNMTERLGKTMDLLRTLEDFCLVRLEPESGRFIKGFGAAYEVNPMLECTQHITTASQNGENSR